MPSPLAEHVVDRGITRILRWSALRRAIAAACTAALLIVGFAHSLHHFDTAIPAAAASYAGSDPQHDTPDSSEKARVAIEHCHGCVMVATAVAAQAAPPIFMPREQPAVAVDRMRPHPPVAETPPPIPTI